MTTNEEFEEWIDRAFKAELEHARRTEFEKTGLGKIEYKNGAICFTPIYPDQFYKKEPKND